MMNSKDLYNYLEKLGNKLTNPTKLTLIGSSVGLLKAQPDRATDDIDIWLPSSKFNLTELKEINKILGIKIDLPGEEILENDSYIQLESEGVAKMGKFEAIHFMNFGNLDIFVPPTEFIIASKLRLVVDEPKHENDISFLINIDNVQEEAIVNAINTLPFPDCDIAKENMVFFFYKTPKAKL